MKIALIVAMDSEFREVKALLGGERGRVGGNEILVSRCGIGKVNAALGTMRIIEEERPGAIISTGVAGGVDEGLKVMDVVAGAVTCYHDVWCGCGNEKGQVQGFPARYAANTTLLTTTRRMGIKSGLICTGDRFVEDKAELQKIKSDFPDALAVDMESAAIAQTCHIAQTPFISLRMISDTPGNTDNHARQYEVFWRDMSEKSFCVVRTFLEKL
ncbi:MAG: 5'-methylthioadenosine/S-adenosylhomocysteine nucleosidase [Bacteroidales bacterium]|nr:5'-methylthioadenosine/S-adenosylhomocysteine nucleosidase [Bacteroidales bacterium]